MNNCRVCLQLSDHLTILSDEYREKFTDITGVRLFETIQEFLCKSCLGRLMYAQKFRDEAQQADEWFQEQNPTLKTELEEPMEIYEEEERLDEEYEIETIIEVEPVKIKQEAESQETGLKCGICPNSATFKTKGSLTKHMQHFHSQKTEQLNNRENLGPRPFVCEFCGQSFKKAAAFTFHVRSHTNELHKCPEPNCKATFRQASNMKKHFKAEHGADKNPYVCEICEATFPLASDLRVHHLQKHEKSKGGKLKCSDCDKEFSYPSQLKQHMVSHLGEKNFQCKMCEKAYFKASNLRRHYQTAHLKEYKEMVASGELRKVKGDEKLHLRKEVPKPNVTNRRHKCSEPDCDASFHQIKHLQDHLETKHSIEAVWTCEDCDLTFAELSTFNAHQKKEHTYKGPYPCMECEREFPYPSLLRNHVAFVHRGESLSCEVCLRGFSRMSHLLRHYRQLHNDFYKKMVDEGKIRPRKSRKVL